MLLRKVCGDDEDSAVVVIGKSECGSAWRCVFVGSNG